MMPVMNAAQVKLKPAKRWAIAACLVMLFTLAAPTRTFASAADEEVPTHDARLDGYAPPQNLVLDVGGTALMYVLLALLGALCIGVLFIKTKRTHLD